MRTLIVVFVLTLAAAGASNAKSCRDPKTGAFVKCPPAASVPGPTASMSTGAPHCTTGKPCGNSCIAKNKTCHK
jgi:hypothetical protein